MSEARTRRILRLLADLKPRTTVEIAEATGLPQKEVHGALAALRRRSLLDSEPVCYFITPMGSAEAARVPAEPTADALRRRQKRAELRAGLPKKKPGRKPKVRVDQPAANEDALQDAWRRAAS